MSWEERLRQMVLAGGLLSFAGCGGTHPIINTAADDAGAGAGGGGGGGAGGYAGALGNAGAYGNSPCGNANPDFCMVDGSAGTGDAGVTVIAPDASLSFPCGNANPDPCICGRPDASTTAEAECDAETACVAAGGVYDPTTFTNADGVTTPPHCVTDAGASDSETGPADGSNG